ncbi:hypothetical protein L1987_74873 [Smallanthus sonchifolius]|uniref:Uncharacterized protein n=1 Tax=Smallanthus sonchifolius TaxID=185202 RepID=A0ACB9A3R8_9ASTR|nr:hypothetical protein L1987_74873 [Smallanthus sonchifolius]
MAGYKLMKSKNAIAEDQIIVGIKKIMYAAEEDASIVEEAQAMILNQGEYKMKSDCNKRKSIINLDVDVAASATLSPRQRVVHWSGSPLMTY